MDEIMQLAAVHNLYVIEDCAQAHGATYKGKMVGSIGHIGAWSFCQDKIMTTGGEGGMVTTNDRGLWSKMWSYKDHGKSWEAVYERTHPPGFRWLHESFGTNWRMLEIQAVIGRIQLKRMPEWSKQRRINAETIWSYAKNIKGLRIPTIPAHIEHAAYKCYVFIEPKHLKPSWSRDKIISAINEKGIPCYSGSCSEVYLEKAFDNTSWRPKYRLPTSKELGETSLMFLVHPNLLQQNIEYTCLVLKQVMTEATL
jgi:dTDP-4-amino-4,6-dideoxygalactose transaminase